METDKREPGGRMVESRTGPVRGRGSVTQGAVQGESGGLMGRIRGVVVIGEMAAAASRAGQAVVIAHVARCAQLCGM